MALDVFRGLNNLTDPLRMGPQWLVTADNIDITDTGGIAARAGYTKVYSGSITGAFSTADFTRTYIVDGGNLKQFSAGGTARTLASGLSPAQMHFTELNDQVFYNNGTDDGVISRDGEVQPWRWPTPGQPSVVAVAGSLPPGLYQVRCCYQLADGRVTGTGDPAEIVLGTGQALQITGIPQLAGAATQVYIAPANSTVYQLANASAPSSMVWNASPDALGRELLTAFLDDLPADTDVIQAWGGRIYAAQFVPSQNVTIVWYTLPLGYHLFNLNESFFTVPGRVLMLAPHDDALVVGTDMRIYAYDGKQLVQLAQYGVVPGWHWAVDAEGSRILFWSLRGLCAVMPFTNLTERQVSVAPGIRAGGAVVHAGGQRRYLVALNQGGSAFNSRA